MPENGKGRVKYVELRLARVFTLDICSAWFRLDLN
jgi:hypothetical protein